MSIAIINQQLKGHKVICIMLSIDIYIIDIILNTHFRLELFPLIMLSQRKIL